MTHHQEFKDWALDKKYNLHSNTGSRYYSSKATRIAYFHFVEGL